MYRIAALSYTAITVPMQQPQSWWQKVASYFSLNNDARLLKKYKIPHELEEQLNDAAEHDEAFKQEISKEYFVCKCPKDLLCYIKGSNRNWKNERTNISRIENLENLETAKNENAPDDVVLPTKFLWHQKNRALKLNDFNYFVVSEELEPIEKDVDRRSLEGIDDKQLDNFCWFLRNSGYYDNHSGNVFFTYDYSGKKFWEKNFKKKLNAKKRIAVIDTERSAIGDNFKWALGKLNIIMRDEEPSDETLKYKHPILQAHYIAKYGRGKPN